MSLESSYNRQSDHVDVNYIECFFPSLELIYNFPVLFVICVNQLWSKYTFFSMCAVCAVKLRKVRCYVISINI